MLREYVELVETAMQEGISKGFEMFLEGVDSEIAVENIIEECGGIDNILAEVFIDSGYEEDENSQVLSEESDIDEKLDRILDEMKEAGIV